MAWFKSLGYGNSDGHVGPLDFSSQEHVVGSWTDGRPVYAKTISFNNTPIGYDRDVHTEIAHNISNLDLLVDLLIMCPSLNLADHFQVYNNNDGASIIANFRVDDEKIYATGGTNHVGATEDRWWYFTLYYVKTQ